MDVVVELTEDDPKEMLINNSELLGNLSKSTPGCLITRVAFLSNKLLSQLVNNEPVDESIVNELQRLFIDGKNTTIGAISIQYLAKSICTIAGMACGEPFPRRAPVRRNNEPLFTQKQARKRATMNGHAHVVESPKKHIKSEMLGDEDGYPTLPQEPSGHESLLLDAGIALRTAPLEARVENGSNGKSYTCLTCGKVCLNQHQYASHVRYTHPRAQSVRVNGVSKIDTDKSDDYLPTTEKKKPSGLVVRPYTCRQCGMVLESQQSYASHVRYLHPKAPGTVTPRIKTEERKPNGEKIYRCRRCNKVFDNAPGIAGHTRHCMLANGDDENSKAARKRRHDEMHGTSGRIVGADRSTQFVERGLESEMAKTCSYCGEMLHSIHGVDKHIRNKHNDHRGEIYHCSQCNRKFMTLGGLENHWLYYMDCPEGKLKIVLSSPKRPNISALLENGDADGPLTIDDEDDEMVTTETVFHQTPVTLYCTFCEYTTTNEQELLDHKIDEHSEEFDDNSKEGSSTSADANLEEVDLTQLDRRETRSRASESKERRLKEDNLQPR